MNDHDLSEDVQQRCERSGLRLHTVEVEEHQPGHLAHVGGELVAADSPWVLIHWYKIRLTESSNSNCLLVSVSFFFFAHEIHVWLFVELELSFAHLVASG